MPYLIDTHAHLNHEDYSGDLTEAIERAHQAGVKRVLVAGYDMKTSERAVEITAEFESIAASVGIHPHDARCVDPNAINRLKILASGQKVVAIGEIGLDFYRDLNPRDIQEEAFRAQIRLAHELDLPIIVHNRDAGDDVLRVLRSEPEVRGVMHCFSEDAGFAKQVVDLGFYIGIAGPVTYKPNETLREVVSQTPLDRLLVETDCPYLSPQKYRGKRNEPAYVVYVAEKIAEVKGISFDTVAETTTKNAFELFGKW